MKRIYLGKSNLACPTLVLKVREMLATQDAEVVEYKSGKYSNELLLSCDELLIIPDLANSSSSDISLEITLGKGLYGQIQDFIGNKSKPFGIISEDSGDGIYTYVYNESDEVIIDVTDDSDFINYASVFIDKRKHSHKSAELNSYLNGLFKVNEFFPLY